MKRSKVDHALSKVAVNAAPPPSDLAIAAIVAGMPVDETRPESAGAVEFSWPPRRTCL